MVEMCKSADTSSISSNDILALTNRKLLGLRHLVNHKSATINWAEKLALKYKAINQSYQMIQNKSETLKKANTEQKLFMKKLLELSARWKLTQQGNNIFAIIGKNSQGDDYKILLLKDTEKIIRVELPPEMKKLKNLKVNVWCKEIQIPETRLLKNVEFSELEEAEQLLIDGEIMKEINNKIMQQTGYIVHKCTKQDIVLFINVINN